MAPALVVLLLIPGAVQIAMPPPADSAGDGARRSMREARLVIEGDSAPAVMARWSAGLTSDSSDRAADSADQTNVRSWQANIARDQGDLPYPRH